MLGIRLGQSFWRRNVLPESLLWQQAEPQPCDSWNGGYGVEERQELVEDRSAFLDVFVSYFPLAKVMKAVCSSGKLACAGLRSVNKISSCYGRSLRRVADRRITQMHYFRNFLANFGEDPFYSLRWVRRGRRDPKKRTPSPTRCMCWVSFVQASEKDA